MTSHLLGCLNNSFTQMSLNVLQCAVFFKMLLSVLLDILKTCIYIYFLYCLKCPVRVRVCSCVVSLFLWKKEPSLLLSVD